MTAPTLMVEIVRGGHVESRHRGSAVISRPDGAVWSAGDILTPIFPRSAIKPIQALPLIETGAADRYGLTDRHIALACASHGGEPQHIAEVQAWLDGLGLSDSDLECGWQWPKDEDATRELARAGTPPSALHNNCSGKHTGMLCTARHCGEPTGGYSVGDHPVQRRWLNALADVTDTAEGDMPSGIDGCSIPAPALPLHALARGFARMADKTFFQGVRGRAVARVRDAMAREPYFVGGARLACTRMMEATEGRVLVKVGAEGVFTGMVPESGLGFALKIEDGAVRAGEVAVVALIRQALGPAHALSIALTPFATVPIQTRRGVVAGVTQPAGVFGTDAD